MSSGGGGFLPTPTPSVHSPSQSDPYNPTPLSPSYPSHSSSLLPQPRSTPLRPNSAKEAALRRYVEEQLLRISGRYESRHREGIATNEAEDETTSSGDGWRGESKDDGYRSFAEIAKDLRGVLDVLWVSGTASLQIPFQITLSLSASTYVSGFPFSPSATFALFRALDHAWSSLLSGSDIATGAPLPMGRRLTMTEKVRLRGIAEGTRLRVARAASGESRASAASNAYGSAASGADCGVISADGGRVSEIDEATDTEMETATEAETDAEMEGRWWGEEGEAEDPADVEMGVARVYERTLVELGKSMDGAEDVGWR